MLLYWVKIKSDFIVPEMATFEEDLVYNQSDAWFYKTKCLKIEILKNRISLVLVR